MKKSSQQKRAKQARRSHEQRKNVARTMILLDLKRAYKKAIDRFKNGRSLNQREQHVIDTLIRAKVLRKRNYERERHPQAVLIEEDRHPLSLDRLFFFLDRPIVGHDRSWRG